MNIYSSLYLFPPPSILLLLSLSTLLCQYIFLQLIPPFLINIPPSLASTGYEDDGRQEGRTAEETVSSWKDEGRSAGLMIGLKTVYNLIDQEDLLYVVIRMKTNDGLIWIFFLVGEVVLSLLVSSYIVFLVFLSSSLYLLQSNRWVVLILLIAFSLHYH